MKLPNEDSSLKNLKLADVLKMNFTVEANAWQQLGKRTRRLDKKRIFKNKHF